MSQKRLKSLLPRIVLMILLVIVWLHNDAIFYTLKEYLVFPLIGVNKPTTGKQNPKDRIPEILHHIHFNIFDKEMSNETKRIIESCKNKHPEMKHILWNESRIKSLIHNHYPEEFGLYQRQKYWVTKIDIAKYIVLHHMGGYYFDTDMYCTRHFREEITTIQPSTSVILYRFNIYKLQTDWMASKAQHAFMKNAITKLHESNRDFFSSHFTIMMKAGPIFLYGVYLNYPSKEEVLMLPRTPKFMTKIGGKTWRTANSKFFYLLQAIADMIEAHHVTFCAVLTFILWYLKPSRIKSILGVIAIFITFCIFSAIRWL